MDETSKATASDPNQAVESAEPSLKKQRLSTEPLTLEEEFKALRDEYDERRLDKMVEEKLLTEVQRSVLRKPVPEDMTSSDYFLGGKHRELAGLVSRVGFAKNEQNRRILGIVQPYGTGKTKTALMLSNEFVVLPIRWSTSQLLLSKLTRAQRTLFKEIQETDNAADVTAFSGRCLRLVGLALLSIAAAFNACAKETNWFNARMEVHRLQFAILAISSGSSVVTEMAKWFDDHIKKTTDVDEFDDLQEQVLDEVKEKSGLRIVFVIDEMQELEDKCLGYCLHEQRVTLAPHNPVALINNWKEEHNEKPAEGHTRCTDLFYQVCCVMTRWLGNNAFVVCSTLFHTWTLIEQLCKSVNRRPLERFINVHSFDSTDCTALIQHYFRVEPGHLSQLDLTEFARPLFACDFITLLYVKLRALDDESLNDISDWLRTSSSETLQACERDLRTRLDRFLKESVKVKTGETTETTTDVLLNKLVMAVRLSAGILREVKADSTDPNWHPHASLIDAGFLKLRSLPGVLECVEIADPMAARILSERCPASSARETRMVMEMYANHIDENDLFTSQDTSHKGFVFERLLAYLALRGLITVPKYAVDRTVTLEQLRSTAQFVAKFDELKAARYISQTTILANEVAYVGALFGSKQLPSKLNCVLLPCTQNGPDVIFRGRKVTNGQQYDAVNVAIQSKVLRLGSRPLSKTGAHKTGAFGFKEFMAALKTIDPARMFHAVNSYHSLWQERREQALRRAPYVRIVFAFRGFSIKVQHFVHEYNLQQVQSATPSFIHLLNVNDLRESLGPVYGALIRSMQSITVEPNLVVEKKMPCYESDWKQLPKETKEAKLKDSKVATEPTLLDLCRLWGIKHSNKKKEDLVTALNEHEQTLAERIQQLSLGPSVAAPPSTSGSC